MRPFVSLHKNQLTIPVPRPMNRFWKYLQGEVHMAFFLGHANCARQLTNVRSHSQSWWEQRLPWPFLAPTINMKWQYLGVFDMCLNSYRNKETLRCISTCRAQSRAGCTLGPCRRLWCSTSHAFCSIWNTRSWNYIQLLSSFWIRALLRNGYKGEMILYLWFISVLNPDNHDDLCCKLLRSWTKGLNDSINQKHTIVTK